MPLRVEVDGLGVGEISGVGSINITNPRNPLAFGGRVTWYSDELGHVQFINPYGIENTHNLAKVGDSASETFVTRGSASDDTVMNYLVIATRIAAE